MGATYTFNYADLVAAYPEFGNIGSGLGQTYFDRASDLFANDGTGPESDAGRQQRLMLRLTAHIAWLSAPRDAQGNPASSGAPPDQVVGRISSASEGSVSVSAEFNADGSPSQAWYTQTRYGAEYWTATARFRRFLYRPNPTRPVSAAFPSSRFGRRW